MLINKRTFLPKRYSSGEMKLVKQELDSFVVNNKIEVVFENKQSFFELLLILDYYINNNVLVDLILTYLPYQRMDKYSSSVVRTLTGVETILNNLKLNSITICEPHTDISNINGATAFSFVGALKDRVFSHIAFNEHADTIIFPDKGSAIKYKHLSQKHVYFNKVRDKETGLIVKHEIVGELINCNKVIIIDDIISTGDTIINIIDMLTLKGITNIYVLSGHFEVNKYNKRVYNHPSVAHVFATNSLQKRQNKKLTLYNVKDVIYEKHN